MRRFFRHHGLTIVLMTLFLGSLIGQIVSGYCEHAKDQQEHGNSVPTWMGYLATGHFLEALAENLESEFLQMGAFVYLTVFLYQKGSPESKDPDGGDDPVDEDPALHTSDPQAPSPVRRGGWRMRLYGQSLGLAFAVLFVGSFIVHAFAGHRSYVDELIAHHQDPVSVGGYLASSRFWFESFQNWQSEFLSIAAMVYLSVYLRQRGSTESKPVAAPHHAHGD